MSRFRRVEALSGCRRGLRRSVRDFTRGVDFGRLEQQASGGKHDLVGLRRTRAFTRHDPGADEGKPGGKNGGEPARHHQRGLLRQPVNAERGKSQAAMPPQSRARKGAARPGHPRAGRSRSFKLSADPVAIRN